MNKSLESLERFRKDFPVDFDELDEMNRDYDARVAKLSLAGTPLSIGIIGQVKAGKSSFLNALLFKGEAVLPKAATPKTANLTRIRYGEQAALVVRFYSDEEWRGLEKQAAGTDTGDATRAAQELVRHARARGTPVAECVAKGELRHTVDSVADLQAVLNEYVGEDGRLTPIVAATEIFWPHPDLLGVEIVDTPGVNDPILSRVQKTRNYLAECDVVFLLSRASNFLDTHDVELFTQQAPAKGVKRLALVGTQFDAVLLEDGYDRDSLAATCANVTKRLTRHATHSLEPFAQRLRLQDRTVLAERIATAAQRPYFMSSFAYAFAQRAPDQWAEDERHTYARFGEMAEEVWSETPPDAALWGDLSGFAPLQQALEHARQEKEAILAEKRAQLEPDRRARLAEWANNTAALARERIQNLERNDLAELAGRETVLARQMARIATALAAYVGEAAQAARARSRILQVELREAATRAARLETHTGQETRRYSTRVSDSTWYKPWTWGTGHTEYSSETTYYRFVAVSDAVDQTLGYVRKVEADLAAEIERLVAPAQLSSGLRRMLLDVIDMQDKRYDPLALRALVVQALDAIQWPRWDFTLPDPTGDIIARFGDKGEIRDDSVMADLRRATDALVGELNQRFARLLDQQVDTLGQQLGTMANTLEQRLTDALQVELAQLRADLQEGEAAKTRYADFLAWVKELQDQGE